MQAKFLAACFYFLCVRHLQSPMCSRPQRLLREQRLKRFRAPSRSGRPAPLWSCVGGLRNGSESLQNLQSIFCNYTFILNLLNFKLDDSFTLIFLYVVISKFFVHLCSHADIPIAF